MAEILLIRRKTSNSQSINQSTNRQFCFSGLQHLYAPKMENEDYDVSTIDKFRLTYDGPDLEIIERIRRMYERVPFGKSKDVDDEEEGGGRKKKRRKKLKFLVRFREDLEFRRKFILTLGLLWSFMILVSMKLSLFFRVCMVEEME